MFIKKLLIVFLSFAFSIPGIAQKAPEYSTKKKKAIELFEESEPFLIRGQYGQAIQLLQESLSKDQEFAEAHLRLGSLYRNIGNIGKATLHLSRAVEILPDNSRTSGAYFSLADIYFQEQKYALADEYLESFIKVSKGDKRLEEDINRLRANIDFSREAIKRPLSFEPKPLGPPLNRFQLQYFPVLTADKNNLIFTRREGVDPQYDEDIVVSRKENGKWTEPALISPLINTANNEGTTAISADGRMLIFTSCMGRKGFGSCDLYVSYKYGEDWSEPENLGPNINASSWESQPSLSADGRTLYFVSDRPGGQGKRDIWVSNFDGESWVQAKNAGEKINTKEDEVSPFIHVNGQTLYFASKGFPGFGGYDLFSADLTDVGWTNPENLGYPLNNNADQVSLFISSDGSTGYYSYEENYRTQNYNSRIYEFKIPVEIQVENKSNFVEGQIFDADTKKPLGAQIELYDIEEDRLIGSVSSDSVNGRYLMVLTQGSEYGLYVNREGYLFKSLSFDYSENFNLDPIKIDIMLDPIKKGTKSVLKNIFFDIDDYTLRSKSKTELNRIISFLKNNQNVSVEIGGHTDDIGSEDYNMGLSISRSKEVFDYLINNGLKNSQLKYKGYGESQPLLPNISEENRQLNRRIEFKIL